MQDNEKIKSEEMLKNGEFLHPMKQEATSSEQNGANVEESKVSLVQKN